MGMVKWVFRVPRIWIISSKKLKVMNERFEARYCRMFYEQDNLITIIKFQANELKSRIDKKAQLINYYLVLWTFYRCRNFKVCQIV